MTTDASDRNQLIPIMSHFFNQINRVRVKLMKVHWVEFKIFDIIVNITMNTVQKFNTEDKMICFCSNNMNTNFGKAQNHNINNVFTKLENDGAEMYLELVVCMHNSYLCAQTSCSILPIKIEVVVVKIYKYFLYA